MNQHLLQIREELKERKPEFIRQDHYRRKRLGRKLRWRKPKGIHSKIRHHFKGRRKMPSPGYKSPAEVRGLHATGLEMVRVFSPEEVGRIKKDAQGIIISKNVGKKKRYGILQKAKDLSVPVLNIDIGPSIKKIEDFISSKKTKAKELKKEPLKETKKPEEAKETKEITYEEKKEAEKREMDKVLTKKV